MRSAQFCDQAQKPITVHVFTAVYCKSHTHTRQPHLTCYAVNAITLFALPWAYYFCLINRDNSKIADFSATIRFRSERHSILDLRTTPPRFRVTISGAAKGTLAAPPQKKLNSNIVRYFFFHSFLLVGKKQERNKRKPSRSRPNRHRRDTHTHYYPRQSSTRIHTQSFSVSHTGRLFRAGGVKQYNLRTIINPRSRQPRRITPEWRGARAWL